MQRRARSAVPWFGVLAVALLCGCGRQDQATATSTGLANPASVYCVKLGGKVEIVEDESGGQQGMCHLPDGTIVEEWELFRRKHPRGADRPCRPRC